MKEKPSAKDLNQFFSIYKELPNTFTLEKVHHFVNSSGMSAAPRGQKLNLQKIIIMTSALILIAFGYFLWPESPSADDSINKNHSELSFIKEIKEDYGTKKLESHHPNHTYPIPYVEPGDTSDCYKKYPGEDFIISLTNEELERIGFFIEKSGIYYKNEYHGKKQIFHCKGSIYGNEITHILNFENINNRKRDYSSFDFYPVTISNLQYTSFNFENEVFKSINDTLLPIRIKKEQAGNRKEDFLIWFNITESLFENLPSNYKNLKALLYDVKYKKKGSPDFDFIDYKPQSIVSGINLLELSHDDLINLGFNISDSSLTFKVKIDNLSGFGFGFFKKGNFIDLQKDSTYIEKIKLYYISNIYGENGIQWENKANISKYDPEVFKNKIQLLIPIFIKQSSYPNILYQDQIFWFEPSETLFDVLPPNIGNQIRREYRIVTSEEIKTKDSNNKFVYFETPDTKFDLQKINISPNPANQSVKLELTLGTPIKGSISLLNVNGAYTKQLVFNAYFKQGLNSIDLDISDISPGIYLILINTAKGYATHRIIISR